jgi:hypothetical protein
MLSKYEPAEEVVGGTFFSENELDEDLVLLLSQVIYKFILQRVRVIFLLIMIKKSSQFTNPFQYLQFHQTRQQNRALLDLSSPDYPNVSDITNFINSKRLLRDGNVKPNDVQTLLDKLIFQGSIIKFFRFSVDDQSSNDLVHQSSSTMRLDMGSSKRLLDDDDAADLGLSSNKRIKIDHGNDDEDDMYDGMASWCYRINPDDGLRDVEALMEIPCGKCPVFQFCSEDGPVSPSNCQYFKGGWFKG